MKISTLSDGKGNILAVLRGGESKKVSVRLRPEPDQHWHEIELPEEAIALKPHEICRRLKIPSPGLAPVFSKE